MRGTSLLVAVALLTAPLAGCAQDGGEAEPVEVAWEQEPRDVQAGEATSMTWSLSGPEGEIPHTGVHWANHSVSDPSTPGDYGNTTKAVEPASVPGSFDAEETFEEAGTYYVRAHAIADGEHRWSEEAEVTVEEAGPAEPPVEVSIEQAPDAAETGENVTVRWRVSGPAGQIQHTGFHWADESVPEPESPADYGNATGVREPAHVNGSSTFDGTFAVHENGTVYARAHAIHEGSHHWSDEIEIDVANASDGAPGADAHSVAMEDAPPRFEPAELTVRPGDNVTWVNQGNVVHTATNASINLTSGDVDPGGNFTWTVPADLEPGTYRYHCEYHEDLGMVANLTVEAPG